MHASFVAIESDLSTLKPDDLNVGLFNGAISAV
jgi:hypothetical protein